MANIPAMEPKYGGEVLTHNPGLFHCYDNHSFDSKVVTLIQPMKVNFANIEFLSTSNGRQTKETMTNESTRMRWRQRQVSPTTGKWLTTTSW